MRHASYIQCWGGGYVCACVVCICVGVCVCCPGWEPVVHLVLGMKQVGHSQNFRRKNRVNCQNPFPGLVFFLLACSHIETGGLGTNNAQCFAGFSLPQASNKQISQRLLCRLSQCLELKPQVILEREVTSELGELLSGHWYFSFSYHFIPNSFKEWPEWQNGGLSVACLCVCSLDSIVSNSLRHYSLPARHLCWRDSPGNSIGVGCHALLQGIFLTHRLNLRLPCLLHCRQILYPLS